MIGWYRRATLVDRILATVVLAVALLLAVGWAAGFVTFTEPAAPPTPIHPTHAPARTTLAQA